MTLLLSLLCVYPTIMTRFDYNMMNLQAKGLQSVGIRLQADGQQGKTPAISP